MEFTNLNISDRIYVPKLHANRIHGAHHLCLLCTCSDWWLTSVNIRVMTKCTWSKHFQVYFLLDKALKIQHPMLTSIIWLLRDFMSAAHTPSLPCVFIFWKKKKKKRPDINSKFWYFYINITSLVKTPSIKIFQRFEATVVENGLFN